MARNAMWMSPKQTSRTSIRVAREVSSRNVRRCRCARTLVGCEVDVGEVIAFEEIVRMRRQRVAREHHLRCCVIVEVSIAAARAALVAAPAEEWGVRFTRLCKLEELETYARALG